MKNIITFHEFEQKIDLSKITFLVTEKDDGPRWKKNKALEISKFYVQFLYLSYLYPDTYIVPNKDVDEYWHYHILDTEKYYEDCINMYGRLLHHYPYLGTKGPEDVVLLNNLFINTNKLYKKHFGKSPSDFNNYSSACGAAGKCSKKPFSVAN